MKNLVPVERITSKIFLIRGQKLMLDRDLVELYGVATKVLKQAVRRNMSRFPSDFMFQLSQEEQRALRSQFVTLKRGQHSIPRLLANNSPRETALVTAVGHMPNTFDTATVVMPSSRTAQ